MATPQCWCYTNVVEPDAAHPHNTDEGCPVLPVPKHPAIRCWCSRDPVAHVWAPNGGCPDSGPTARHEPIAGGGHREANGDRPRFDLLWSRSQPLERQILYRDAVWAQKGAAKYGERNWEQFNTQEALDRCLASLGRHYAALTLGLTDEDHAAAIRENVRYIEYIRERLAEKEQTE